MKDVVLILSACALALSAAGCGGLEFEKPRTFSEYGNSEFLALAGKDKSKKTGYDISAVVRDAHVGFGGR